MLDWEKKVRQAKEQFWQNPKRLSYDEVKDTLPFSIDDVDEAKARLERFAPLLMELFPETKETNGLIESPLLEIGETKKALEKQFGKCVPKGRLFMKCDSDLAIAGSVKARGGIYEVLKHTEDLALQNHLIGPGDTYDELLKYKDFFKEYTIQVGSTGNLGMSIGIMSAAIGYRAIVHMSSDAKEWKKDLLRSKGVIVKEYASDYSKAVEEGRLDSIKDSKSYFVDDEKSKDLFLGYSVAAGRLQAQFKKQQLKVDATHPLFVYLPCGVGGAPGGITYGLKQIWGDNVHCIFVEPTQAPCMLVALASSKMNQVCVKDYDLSGNTLADGLAVGRASELVSKLMSSMIDGVVSVADENLIPFMRMHYQADNHIIEPSSCAAFSGYLGMADKALGEAYFHAYQAANIEPMHLIWATGGSLMPQTVVDYYLQSS